MHPVATVDSAAATSFAAVGLNLDARSLDALQQDGIVAPTEIQAMAAPALLAGDDAVLRSGTGTGKTLAYLLPLLQRAAALPDLVVLVLAPSPELAVQIQRVAERYAPAGLGCVGLVGGGSLERQKERLKKHPRLLVGTPGRVLELILARKVKAARLGAIVLDEVDQVLDPSLADRLFQVLSRPEVAPQLVCASATLGPTAEAFIGRFLRPTHRRLAASAAGLPPTITHHVVGYDRARKEISLLHLLRDHRVDRAIVFVARQGHVAHLADFMERHGVPALGLSAERNKQARAAAMAALRAGHIRLLVATDAAARGLDVPGLPWVIHYEPARDAETYVHRAGRTGRAGAAGGSLTLAMAGERAWMTKLARSLDLVLVASAGKARAAPVGDHT